MKLRKSYLIIIILMGAIAHGQNFFPILGGQRVGTSVFTFLKIGVSARAVGMGEAVVALSQDASALFYNPAAVGQFERPEILATHIQWPAGIEYDFFGYTQRLVGRHFIGVSAGILYTDPMIETTVYRPDGTGNYFTYQNRFFGLTYSAKMTDRFSFGITAKHVTEDLAGNIMRVWLMDLGTFYWTGFKSLRFCAAISHFGPQAGPDGYYMKKSLDKFTGQEIITASDFEIFSPPTVFRVGSAIDLIAQSNQLLTIALQLNHPVDDAENIVMGSEYVFMNTISVRGGYKFNHAEENYSYGLGLTLPAGPVRLKVDFAYTNFIHLSDPKRLSIGMTF